MTDNLKPSDRKRTMQAVKSKGTKLERKFFAALAGMGIGGWRKHVESIIGKPDAVFPKRKIAIFIDGCFWHGCPVCKRKLPQTNRKYWKRKIEHNIELAIHYEALLKNAGWKVIRIWEHDLNSIKELEFIKDLKGGKREKRKP